jgi:hypothetical protein
VWIAEAKSKFVVMPVIEQIIATGYINRQQHLQLASAILSDLKITEEERRQINRVFDYLQTGCLKLVD